MRKLLIAGNWKMHKTVGEAVELVRKLKELLPELKDREVLVCPPFTALYAVGRELRGSSIILGAQDLFWEDEGAFTGEISPLMLKDVGCRYVIVGHSERRRIFKETDDFIKKKVLSAVRRDLIPILCVGETLEEREAGRTESVVENQVREGLSLLDGSAEFVVAYEPVWAIGTGRTAEPEDAQKVQSFIRDLIGELFGRERAERTRILYGGSVKPENAEDLIVMKDIDGFLVGGASLKAESFASIVTAGTEV